MKTNQLPTIKSYGNYSSGNYGVNTLMINIKGLTLFYSYKTIVAFEAPNTGLVVRENSWGPTTGKHLNWIDWGNKEARIPGKEFESKLKEVLDEL